jgi:pectin methylesterase-like acyl-CoA thioesterase
MDKYDLPTEVARGASYLTLNGIGQNNSTSVSATAGSTIVIPVSGKTVITVAGWYAGTWNINGQNEVTADSSSSASSPVTSTYTTDGTETSVTVNVTGDGANYLYWIEVLDASNSEFKASINVPGDYDTLKDAVTAIKAMDRPEGEDGRVTINLTADIQEQIVFDAPYITLNGNGHEINWYYGQTGFYYSVDPSTGLYSETLFRDKYSKTEGNGSLWGGVAIIRGDYFIAEDTTFKNTFNYYVTEKEIEDGAYQALAGGLRQLDTDVTVNKAKERSNAFYIEADHVEAYNCKILSSQDTLGRNGSANNGYHTYFKDCVIGGNVDYICGEFTAIFDNCQLQWKAYSNDDNNNAKIGYIVAPKTSPNIFRNCVVTVDPAGTTGVLGYYGRTWGSNSNATFIGCETNGMINGTGWGEMTTGDSATAKFSEYNNTENGVVKATSTAGTALTDAEAEALLSDDVITTYLAGWTPVHYGLDEVELPSVEEPQGIWGDVDKSGVLTANDAATVLSYVLDKKIAASDRYDFTVADVTGDGDVTAADAADILQKVLDGSFKFNVEKNEETTSEATTSVASEATTEEVTEVATEATTEATTEAVTEATTTEPVADVTVYVVGDSTACHYTDADDTYYWYKRVGFGDKLADYLSDNATVVNLALSGRSSKSFATGINENGIVDDSAVANYAQLKSDIKEGDYLIIAWGHNDEKSDKYRYTSPTGGIEDEGSFKNSLYENYIKVAQDAGATPILVTPIIRANVTDLSNNDKHISTGTTAFPGGDYGTPIRELGADLGITVIDQLQNTQDLFAELTPENGNTAPTFKVDADNNLESKTDPTGYYTLHAALQDASVDTTHLNAFGASYVAYMLARDIKASDSTLAEYVKDDITAPTFNHDDCYNTGWVPFDESVYVPSSIWKVSSPWAGSVFGSGVGKFTEDSHPNHDIAEQGENSVRLTSANSAGKIASKEDGVVMYFQEIGADQDFEFTATAHINSYDASTNQVAFGLMLRDNMFSDYAYKTKAPYYAVGSTTQSGKTYSVFSRSAAGALNKDVLVGDASADTFTEGTEVELKISRTNGVVTVQYGSDDAVTYDGDNAISLSGVNADNDYVGVFVSRIADVTFNNINLTLK